MTLQQLFVPTKNKAGADNRDITIAFRAIERWATGVGGIQQITSVDNSVTITNPTGPITDLHVVSSGGGVPYASLTGPGFTTTPGDLTQAGGFTVNDTAGDGISLNSTVGSLLLQGTGGTTELSSIGSTVTIESSNLGSVARMDLQATGTAPSTIDITGDSINVAGSNVVSIGSSGPTGGGFTSEVQIFTVSPTAPIEFQPGTSAASTGVQMQTGSQTISLLASSVAALFIEDTMPSGTTGVRIQSDHGNVDIRAFSPSAIRLNASVAGSGPILIGQAISVTGAVLAMFGTSPGATGPLNLTGSRGGNVALANLLTYLAQLGFIVNNSTP